MNSVRAKKDEAGWCLLLEPFKLMLRTCARDFVVMVTSVEFCFRVVLNMKESEDLTDGLSWAAHT